ncbi:anthrone oxygenase family protein [Mucilaginibacter ximonensis]|uniref:Anthrone oxygenase family protein n=1 Tax=Mucilaginibacter ximonensis TaxID=538021 RepID=A0ABW5YE06_9SPHI
MAQLVNFIAGFLLMLVTGVFFGPWFALTRSLAGFEPAEFIKITRTLSKNLGPTMRFLLPGSILMMTLATFVYEHATQFYLSLPAIALLLISLIITVVVEVPIVKSIEHCTVATLPADWQTRRDRWIRFHVFRTLAALLSFGLWLAIYI